MSHRLFIRPTRPRPLFWKVAEFLWGRGADFDSDGDAANPHDRNWTELTVVLRPACTERVDIGALPGGDGIILVLTGVDAELVARAAWFIARESEATVATAAEGPYLDVSSLESGLGDFDPHAALDALRDG